MSKPATASTALPLAHLALRLLIIGNALFAALMVLLMTVMPTRRWIISALELSPSPETDRIIFGMQVIALIGIGMMALNHVALRRLQRLVDTVRDGDPFVAANADRLKTIAWVLFTLQILGIVIDTIGDRISTSAHPVDLDSGFSVGGWLAVLLTFILARVFEAGAAMRDDLEGTV